MSGHKRRPQDHFGERAKREGYPARSIYKLQEIDQRVRLFRRGQRILDLGASPGSWSLYAAERVGREGTVVGVDLNEPRAGLPPQVRFRTLDVFALEVDDLGGPAAFDVVLSDMAPHTSGQRSGDQFRSYELYMRALEIAEQALAPGGHFVGKIFQGPEFEQARKATRARFETVRLVKPDASRSESFEIFLVGLSAKAATPPTSCASE